MRPRRRLRGTGSSAPAQLTVGECDMRGISEVGFALRASLCAANSRTRRPASPARSAPMPKPGASMSQTDPPEVLATRQLRGGARLARETREVLVSLLFRARFGGAGRPGHERRSGDDQPKRGEAQDAFAG